MHGVEGDTKVGEVRLPSESARTGQSLRVGEEVGNSFLARGHTFPSPQYTAFLFHALLAFASRLLADNYYKIRVFYNISISTSIIVQGLSTKIYYN